MSKAGHFQWGSVEIFFGCPADVQNSGLGPQTGLLWGHEGPAYLPDVLGWHIKSLCALFLPHLPPVLIGLLHQHVPLSLADGDHLVFGLVLIIILHFNVGLAWGNIQPVSVSHDVKTNLAIMTTAAQQLSPGELILVQIARGTARDQTDRQTKILF